MEDGLENLQIFQLEISHVKERGHEAGKSLKECICIMYLTDSFFTL